MQSHGFSPAELEKIHAEIAKLIDDTIKLSAESREFNAEASKLNTEASKFSREIFWYPMAAATGLVTVVAGVTTLVIKLLS